MFKILGFLLIVCVYSVSAQNYPAFYNASFTSGEVIIDWNGTIIMENQTNCGAGGFGMGNGMSLPTNPQCYNSVIYKPYVEWVVSLACNATGTPLMDMDITYSCGYAGNYEMYNIPGEYNSGLYLFYGKITSGGVFPVSTIMTMTAAVPYNFCQCQ